MATSTTHDERIESPIRKLRGMIRTYVSLEGLAMVGVFLALWFWIGMILDYGIFRAFRWDWVQEVPWSARATVLGLVVAGLIALVITRVLMRLLRDFSHPSLALVLERRFPEQLGDRLITAVELADIEKAASYGYSADMIRMTIADVNTRMQELPVREVFNWRRLVYQGFIVGGLTLGGLMLVFLGGFTYQKIVGRGSIGEFSTQSKDVAFIFLERNVLLKDTPWPRDVYLELPDFINGELRVGRDGAEPRIRVVALKWVIADPTVPEGWRPMKWGEVTKEMLGGTEKASLPLPLLQLASKQLTYGAPGFALSPAPFSAYLASVIRPSDAGLRLPTNLPATEAELNEWRVDQVERTFLLNEDVRAYLRLNQQEQVLALETTFEKLGDFARDVSNHREVRLLTIPTRVHLNYWGPKSDNDMDLERLKEGDTEFTGKLADLKESVKLRATAGDFSSDAMRVTLVPPPQLEIFERDEYRPAYIYHRPPVDTKLAGLRGQRQEMLHQGISRTGDRSRFEIPMGTELVIRCSTDKVLTKARLIPVTGKFPGPDSADPLPITLPLITGVDLLDPEKKKERQYFEFAFTDEMRIIRPCEFTLEFTDDDNVTAKRMITIVPIDDKAPEVDVMVEVIRKVGNTYMCTPRAWIPFAKESRIRDDYGLNRVEYRFTYRQQDSAGVVNTRAAIAAGLLMGTPSVPNLGSFIFPAVFNEGYRSILRPVEQKEFSGVETLDGFAELMRERAPGDIVSRVLRDRLKEPAPQFADSRVIREFDFKFGELFDLQKLLPDIEVKDENKYQPRYTIQLTVSATDSNVEQSSRIVPTKLGAMIVGGPAAGLESSDGRTADNKETFTFTIVSEADLLTEISKEEEGLIAKLDEIVTRLKDAQGKLTNIVDRLPTQKPEEMLPDSVTANTIAETAGKCRDMTQDLLKDYARILNEYKVNRLNKKLIEKLDSQIVTPLDQVSRIDFPALEEPLTTFNAAFSEQRKPDINVAIQARDRLKVIVDKLGRIRDGVGEIVSIKKVIELIQNVIKLQETEIKGQLKILEVQAQEIVLKGGVMPAAPFVVQNLQKMKFKIPFQVGLETADDIVLKLEVPINSDIKVPAEVKVPLPPLGQEKVDIEVEIQAGAKIGDFPLKVTPAEGGARTLTITVK